MGSKKSKMYLVARLLVENRGDSSGRRVLRSGSRVGHGVGLGDERDNVNVKDQCSLTKELGSGGEQVGFRDFIATSTRRRTLKFVTTWIY